MVELQWYSDDQNINDDKDFRELPSQYLIFIDADPFYYVRRNHSNCFDAVLIAVF